MHDNQFAANKLAFVPAAIFPIRAEARIGSVVLKTEVCPIKCFLFRLHVNFCVHCEDLQLILGFLSRYYRGKVSKYLRCYCSVHSAAPSSHPLLGIDSQRF